MKFSTRYYKFAGQAETDIIALYNCTDTFVSEMKQKLFKELYNGKTGWDDPNWTKDDMLKRLKEHIDKGDMVDVANFAMFIWNRED